ncbi:MAG: PEP-CTERM sorting domain-containing protein [Gemmataceae bacterium]|nr:PEP-CTERM sorting domain-containing protein [Gemmataceae bacterium]
MLHAGILAMLALAAVAGRSDAGLSFQFADGFGVPLGSSVTINVGATSTIRVYLVQTAGEISGDGNLESFGVKINYTDTGDGIVAKVDNTGDIASNIFFDDSEVKTAGGTSSSLRDAVLFNLPQAPSGGRVFLGSFKFTGLSIGDQDITAGDVTGGDDTLTGNGTVLDALIATATVTITVVPEPSSLALVGVAATGVAGAAYRRWRRRKAAVA